ncbi:MAG TPA: hypothetical protein PKJ63_00680 [Cyclobacteriaceae bacterium]|nr:hypothetical protein [Cyclobacteriaceae bacterium]
MIDIPNLHLPIAAIILAQLNGLSPNRKHEVLNGHSEDDFVSDRVDIFLEELDSALLAGYDELGAKELALKACLDGIADE